MTAKTKQRTLGGDTIQVVPSRRDCHIRISPRTVHTMDMAKFLKFIQKGEFTDICIRIGAVLSTVLPDDVFRSLNNMSQSEILGIVVLHLQEYLSEGMELRFET